MREQAGTINILPRFILNDRPGFLFMGHLTIQASKAYREKCKTEDLKSSLLGNTPKKYYLLIILEILQTIMVSYVFFKEIF